MIWYFHLLKNFPQFMVIYTVKGFGTVNKAEIDVFLELSCFFNNPMDVGNLICGSSVFSKTSLSGHLEVHRSCTVENILTKCGSLEMGMVSHFKILALRTP